MGFDFYSTQITQKHTEEHRFYFLYAGIAQPKFNLCKSVYFCVICVL